MCRNGAKLYPYTPLIATDMAHALAYVGRLEKGKGLAYALHAMPEIVSEFKDTVLYIAEMGVDRMDLEALVKELDIERSRHFYGQFKGRRASKNCMKNLQRC